MKQGITMSITLLPTLSDSAWVSSNRDTVNYVMSYFYESQYSQSQFYYGNISSMSYLLYKYGNDPVKMATEVETTLTALLGRYLNNVTVECSVTPTDSVSASINIYVEFNDEQGNPVTLSNLLLVANSKIVKVINANNTGQVSGNPV
jgi:hypothetical protein